MNSRQDGGPPYLPLNAIATGTPIAMQDGTQINQIGAPAWWHVEIALAAQTGGYFSASRLSSAAIGDLRSAPSLLESPGTVPSERVPAQWALVRQQGSITRSRLTWPGLRAEIIAE